MDGQLNAIPFRDPRGNTQRKKKGQGERGTTHNEQRNTLRSKVKKGTSSKTKLKKKTEGKRGKKKKTRRAIGERKAPRLAGPR